MRSACFVAPFDLQIAAYHTVFGEDDIHRLREGKEASLGFKCILRSLYKYAAVAVTLDDALQISDPLYVPLILEPRLS